MFDSLKKKLQNIRTKFASNIEEAATVQPAVEQPAPPPTVEPAPPPVITPSGWIEHGPFAAWLVEATSPDLLVELGTHWGYSFFAFCEAPGAALGELRLNDVFRRVHQPFHAPVGTGHLIEARNEGYVSSNSMRRTALRFALLNISGNIAAPYGDE